MTRMHTLLAAAAALLVAACGGGDDDARGTIVSATVAAQVTKAQVDAGTAASGLQALSGLARCDVEVRHVAYVTRDPAGVPARASTAVMVPGGSDAACTGQRPVLVYAHGTTTTKSKNMANVASDGEASLVMSMYAAQGYVVVAPNYLGYDVSTLTWHPYLNAEATAIDVVDGLRAAKTHLGALGGATRPSARLLVTGYSQGGHVAMGVHRAIQRDYASEFSVTAAAPMSGPYNLVGFGDIVTGAGPVNAGATLFVPLLLTSYQRSYGNIYASTSQVYQSPFDVNAESLFPTDTPVATLIAQGRLPNDPTFTALFGVGGLLTDSFRATYPTSAYRAALQTNTLLGWNPTAPMAMCGGQADPTVYYAVNTSAAQADFASRGVTVPAWDLENLASLPAGATGTAIYNGFQAQKAAAGVNAQAQYHGTLVPPFCNALARGFFDQVLAATP